jgi:hypothetical protein
VAVLLVTAGISACMTGTAAGPALPCSGQVCTLSIQNDMATELAVRFADSTGKQGALGIVSARGMRVFKLQWMKSTHVRLYVMTRQNDLYNADVTLQAHRATEVHFPSDFTAAEDIVLPGAPAKP